MRLDVWPNDNGQLGHGNRTEKRVFTLVDPGKFGGERIGMAAAGEEHGVVASAAGDVFTWGNGTLSRLGHNGKQDRLTPARLGREQFGGEKIVFVAGYQHIVALAKGGVLWVWGCGDYGRLGLGNRDEMLVPTRLGAGEVFGGSLVRMAACGLFHTLVLTEEGVVWTFGEGEYGRLGLNYEDDRLVPTRLDPQRFAGAQVSTVAAGLFRSISYWISGACRIGSRKKSSFNALVKTLGDVAYVWVEGKTKGWRRNRYLYIIVFFTK